MIHLQERGCHNINFVTPEHVAPQIVEALPHAIEMGPAAAPGLQHQRLRQPGLQVMDGLVDIYMPDFKLWDEERAAATWRRDYPQRGAARSSRRCTARSASCAWTRTAWPCAACWCATWSCPAGWRTRGRSCGWLAELSRDTYLNLMDQYYPAWKAKTDEKYREINRSVEAAEMETAYACAREVGLWRFDRRWRPVASSFWERLGL